jgi:HD-GYP domain-containing protein (c-di-GMP phosphodiesterase class II)
VRVSLRLLWESSAASLAGKENNFRRLLLTFKTLAELGPELTSDRSSGEASQSMLALLMEAVEAGEGALFRFSDRPALLTSLAASGFSIFPGTAVIPLLPKHVHALTTAAKPQALSGKSCEGFLSANGNVAPELFKCIVSLKVGPKLVGMIALGRREGEVPYTEDDFEALGLLSNYIALAVHNHTLSESLQQRVSENLKLMASLHGFYDHTLNAFATAIDAKDQFTRGHSRRVAQYAGGVGQALGMDDREVAGLRAAGLLHDVGKVTVDKYIFSKPGKLEPNEFREMADHTTLGHQIVNGVDFPWPEIPGVVRWHHERGDGSGYPDKLHSEEVSTPVRVMAVADVFDALTSDRAHRHSFTVGEALSEIVRMTPQKFDPNIVQALLIQVRRDAVGRNQPGFLDQHIVCNIAAPDVDHLAAMVHHKSSSGRVHSC